MHDADRGARPRRDRPAAAGAGRLDRVDGEAGRGRRAGAVGVAPSADRAHRDLDLLRPWASTGFCRGCPRCSSSTDFPSSVRWSRSSAMSDWRGSRRLDRARSISDRWERKTLIAIVAMAIAVFGMSYGLSSRTVTIVIFGFLVAMGQQVFAALLYAYTPECFPTGRQEHRRRPRVRRRASGQRIGPAACRVPVRELRLCERVRVHRSVLGDGRDSHYGVRAEDAREDPGVTV